MSVAEEIAKEIYQVYVSGKCGIVLEMEHKQEWEPVIKILQKKYFENRPIIEFCNGKRKVNDRICFTTVVYQRLSKPWKLEYDELEDSYPSSYPALVLEKIADKEGIIFIGNYHLLDGETKTNLSLSLINILKTGSCDNNALILITVDKLENLPNQLFPYIHIIHRKKPNINEIEKMTNKILESKNLKLDNNFKREIISYLQGFQCYEIEYLFQKAEKIYKEEAFDIEKRSILELIGNEKVKLLEKGQLLEWKMLKHVDMANMEVLTKHLHDSGIIMSRLEDAIKQGVDVPKGILIMGLPGTGKSLFAQYAAAKLKMPLIRLEMGRMMGGHVGDSERNLREAQKQAEEMAPCILWIDEIEKGFAGANNKRDENTYLQRMTGSFLTWLQEKKSSCYIIATANSIDGLPPEFFRKGRFDECFFTSMPSEKEIREIMKVHLLKPERAHVEPVIDDAINSVINIAISKRRFMTGADASALISNVFRKLYLDYYETNCTEDKKEYDRKNLKNVMFDEFKKIKVFSETNGEDIAKYDISSKKSNFIKASLAEDYSTKQKTRYDSRLEAFIAEKVNELKNNTNKI